MTEEKKNDKVLEQFIVSKELSEKLRKLKERLESQVQPKLSRDDIMYFLLRAADSYKPTEEEILKWIKYKRRAGGE